MLSMKMDNLVEMLMVLFNTKDLIRRTMILNVGVVLALSFGFLIARFGMSKSRRKRSPPSQTIPCSSSSGDNITNADDNQEMELQSNVEALQETNNLLRQEIEDLAKEIKRLEEEQCANIDEQVYLRWVNACLRYELRNFKPPPGKIVARDLNRNLSPRSHDKAKQLIMEYTTTESEAGSIGGAGDPDSMIGYMDFDSREWSAAQITEIAESLSFDDSSIEISSSLTKAKRSKRTKILSSVKKIILQKSLYSSLSLPSAKRHESRAAKKRNNNSITTLSKSLLGPNSDIQRINDGDKKPNRYGEHGEQYDNSNHVETKTTN